MSYEPEEPNPPTPEPSHLAYMSMPGEPGPPVSQVKGSEKVDPGASLEATGHSDVIAVARQIAYSKAASGASKARARDFRERYYRAGGDK